MIVVDAVSIGWLVVLVIWGYASGQILVVAFDRWPRWERRISEWWAEIPFIADLRERRRHEEAQWW